MTTKNFSPQYRDALAKCITGGTDTIGMIGRYRTGEKIIEFFRGLGHDVSYEAFAKGKLSRVPFTKNLIESISKGKDGFERIVKITERLLDPRDYVGYEGKLDELIGYLNGYLEFDGLEILRIGSGYTIASRGTTAPVIESYGSLVLSRENCRADFERALGNVENDPSGAIGSACSTLESTAKAILDELGEPYPRDQSIRSLMTPLMRVLNLAPDQQSESEVKRILGGLLNIATGVGVLRTKYSSFHGRGSAQVTLDSRHARFAINAASTVASFLLETHLQTRHS